MNNRLREAFVAFASALLAPAVPPRAGDGELDDEVESIALLAEAAWYWHQSTPEEFRVLVRDKLTALRARPVAGDAEDGYHEGIADAEKVCRGLHTPLPNNEGRETLHESMERWAQHAWRTGCLDLEGTVPPGVEVAREQVCSCGHDEDTHTFAGDDDVQCDGTDAATCLCSAFRPTRVRVVTESPVGEEARDA